MVTLGCLAAPGGNADLEREPVAQTETPTRVEVERLWTASSRTERDAGAWRAWGPAGTPPASFGENGLRARWWFGRRPFEVGAGADWVSAVGAVSGRSTTPVLALRAALTTHAQVVYETDAAPGRGADPSLNEQRVALEFRRSSSTRDLRNGLLRMQLSGSSTLNLRPRAGGLQMSYRAQF